MDTGMDGKKDIPTTGNDSNKGPKNIYEKEPKRRSNATTCKRVEQINRRTGPLVYKKSTRTIKNRLHNRKTSNGSKRSNYDDGYQ